TTVTFDFLQQLLDRLNKKAMTKKQCKQKNLNAKKCFRGYRLVVSQDEFDFESFADFDNNPGPDGKTCDITDPPNCPGPPSDAWTWGNDDTGNEFGEPPPPFPGDANGDNGGVTDTDCPDANPA